MKVELKIAIRYLFSRKSHDIITWISRIGVVGIAVGSAALVVVLSVFNGFTELIERNIEENSPFYRIEPVEGSYMEGTQAMVNSIMTIVGVSFAQEVVEEMVAARYDENQAIVKMRGLASADDFWVSGYAARALGIRVQFLSKLELYYPTFGRSRLAPLKSIGSRPKKIVGGDDNSVCVPINAARNLLAMDSQRASYIEVFCDATTDVRLLEKAVGGKCKVLDRRAQNPELYRVMSHEKLAIYLVLFFIIVVVAVNIYASESMLIIEKQRDIESLRAMGADERMVRRIYFTEGMLICFLGMLAGVVAGLLLAWAQQTWGFISMPGNGIVSAYPIKVEWADVLISMAGISLIGALISKLSLKNI